MYNMSSSLDNVPFGSVPYSQHHNPQSTPFGSVSRTAAIAKAMPNIGALANSKTNAVISDYAEQTTFHVVNMTDSTTVSEMLSGGILIFETNVGPTPTKEEVRAAFKIKFGRYPKNGDAFILYPINASSMQLTVNILGATVLLPLNSAVPMIMYWNEDLGLLFQALSGNL